MKLVGLSFLLLLSFAAASQNDSTRVKVNLYLPSHVPKGLSPGQPLVIHYIMEDPGGKMQTGQLIAKRDKDNQYSFVMKPLMYFRMVFVTGGYSAQLFCVDNRKANAPEKYDFNILLEKKLFDPSDLKFMAPCVLNEE